MLFTLPFRRLNEVKDLSKGDLSHNVLCVIRAAIVRSLGRRGDLGMRPRV